MKHFSHLNSAAEIIRLYKGEQPFHYFIKEFFRQHKKYGSKDRKSISRICYAYFRPGNSFPAMAMEERLLTGLFLCSVQPDEILQSIKPHWNAAVQQPLKEKCALAGLPYGQLDIFPFMNELGDTIDAALFALSHLRQPSLFIRIRPGCEEQVLQQLDKASEAWRRVSESCIAFSGAAKIDTLLRLNKEAVVQDYSSQRVGAFLELAHKQGLVHSVWDCCAASGGKSILAIDILGGIRLTVSDIRKSILINLEKRFAVAGITNYTSVMEDLTVQRRGMAAPAYDLIIADVPCSGSGTWGRTPELLSFFKAAEIDRYQALQKKILSNAFPRLKKGGCFLYITCSVFKKENEDMVAFIEEKFHPRLLRMETLKGYTLRADTMFAALFVKES